MRTRLAAAALVVLTATTTMAPARRAAEGLALVAVRVSSPAEARALSGFDLAEAHLPGEIALVLHPGDAARLRSLGLEWRILDPDLVASHRLALLPSSAPRVAPGQTTEYRHYFDPAVERDPLGRPNYVTDLMSLAERFPDKARLLALPERTLEGRTVWGIEIASNVHEPDGRPVFSMDGVHHAREWPAGEMVIMFAYDLLENYGIDPRVTAVVDNVRTILVPVVNPDGFTTSRESLLASPLLEFPLASGGLEGYWRKNRRGAADVVVPGVNKNPTAYGVDPNRNYAFLWGDDVGSSGFALDQTFRGSGPFSEPETRNVRSIVLARPVTAMITHHTFGRLILRPWGHTHQDPPDEALLKALGDAMALSMRPSRRYTSQPGIGLYPTTGTTDDWAYAATGSLGYTFEHGDQFHSAYSVIPTMYADTRTAYLILAEAAANPAYHAVVSGRVVDAAGDPIRASIRITKTFATPTDSGSVTETLDLKTSTRADGTFELHLNPSTRPIAGAPEKYRMIFSAPGTAPRLVDVTVGRGEVAGLGDVELSPA